MEEGIIFVKEIRSGCGFRAGWLALVGHRTEGMQSLMPSSACLSDADINRLLDGPLLWMDGD